MTHSRGQDFEIGRERTSPFRELKKRAAARAPWERSVLDDLVMKRPWNLLVKAARVRGLRRRRPLEPGITVVIVNWNTKCVTADVLTAVQRLSPHGTRVTVVDNGSRDGSRQVFRSWPGINRIMLPANVGHGPALDIAVALTRTRVAVAIDSDAVPLSPHWLAPAVDPLRDGRTVLAGSRSSRNFVHPMYLAIDVETFLDRRLSFQVHRTPGVSPVDTVWGVNAWDTAELLTHRLEPDEIRFVERTPNPVDGLPGMTCGGVVYHHGGVSRAAGGGVEDTALEAWKTAYSRLLALSSTKDHE